MSEMLGKISVKTVCGKIDVRGLSDNPKTLMQIIGVATTFKVGQTDYGAYTKFLGQFKAKNLENGNEYVSGACFLPTAVSELIEGQLAGDESKRGVQFALKIGVKYDESSACKYVFIIENLIKPKENDAIALLEKQLETK